MTTLTMRPYASVADLRRMQDAVSRAHKTTWWHIGDLGWSARNAAHAELGVWVRIWEDAAGDVVGFVWPSATGHSDVFFRDSDAPFDAMLEVVEASAHHAIAAGDVVGDVVVLVGDDEEPLRDAVVRAGFELDDTEAFDVTRRALDDIAAPRLPEGYRSGWVDDALVDGRVEAQRAAFAPSSLTRRMYERVRRTWPYRPELDRVVLDETGSVVAFCTAWVDERTRTGLLEPVGTHPLHQRRGLAAACCLDALHALARAGATEAQVSCVSAAACATYHRVGFVTQRKVRVYRKQTGVAAAQTS